MPAFPVITSAAGSGAIITGFSNITYEQIVASLNSINYKVKYIYFQGDDVTQLATPFLINREDPKGKVYDTSFVPIVDPNQFQPTLYYDAGGQDFIINNLNSLDFNIGPGKTLELFFYNDSVSYEYLLTQKNELPPVAPADADGGGGDDDDCRVYNENLKHALLFFAAGVVAGLLIFKIVRN